MPSLMGWTRFPGNELGLSWFEEYFFDENRIESSMFSSGFNSTCLTGSVSASLASLFCSVLLVLNRQATRLKEEHQRWIAKGESKEEEEEKVEQRIFTRKECGLLSGFSSSAWQLELEAWKHFYWASSTLFHPLATLLLFYTFFFFYYYFPPSLKQPSWLRPTGPSQIGIVEYIYIYIYGILYFSLHC